MNLAAFVDVPYEPDQKFCRVLASRVLASAGIPLPDVDTPLDAIEWQRVDAPQPMDVVVFNLAGQPEHMGVCIGRGRFLHVEKGQRSRIARLTDPMWSPRVEGFYRYTGARA